MTIIQQDLGKEQVRQVTRFRVTLPNRERKKTSRLLTLIIPLRPGQLMSLLCLQEKRSRISRSSVSFRERVFIIIVNSDLIK